MRAAWLLATNSLSQRRVRFGLLIASVTLCAALVVAVACSMASLGKAVETRISETIGAADLRIDKRSTADVTFGGEVVQVVEAWPEVQLVVPRLDRVVELRVAKAGSTPGAAVKPQRVTLHGVEPSREAKIRPMTLVEGDGKLIAGGLGIVLEENTAKALDAKLGDSVVASAGKGLQKYTVTGIAKQPGLSMIFDRLAAYVPIESLSQMQGKTGLVSELDVLLKPKTDPEAFAKVAMERLGESAGLTVNVSAKVSAGLQGQLQSNQIGFILSSTLAFLASAFIITTGLTTGVTEKTRELSIIRCIGGTKGQLAWSQVFLGAMVGLCGGAVGVPMGIAGSAILVAIFKEQMPAGFSFSGIGVFMGFFGSIMAGVIGGLWPAVSAARVSPLEGLSVRSRPIRGRWVWICLVAGVANASVHGYIVGAMANNDATFWTYVFVGVPALMCGYFLVSVPVTVMVTQLGADLLSLLIGLPPKILRRTVSATPYRHGFTAGAMMLGLALMVSIWTNGRAVMQDWLEQLEVPDAFAVGLFPYPEQTLDKIRAVDGVKAATPISLLPVALPPTKAQGVKGLNTFQTSFIGFEPEDFFKLTALKWEMPVDPAGVERAKQRLREGGAIIVSREFLVNREIPLGSKLKVTAFDKTAEFEVVGVVRSPGLDVVSKFYRVGEGMNDQAVNSIFGSRGDLKKIFGYSAWSLIQIGFTDEVKKNASAAAGGTGTKDVKGRTPEGVLGDVKGILGLGILEVGSALEIKARIRDVIGGSMLVASVVAIGAMVIACFAVANLIIAGIQSRQFEFGVLRSLGSPRWLLGRLVLGEALLIGMSACVLGTLMGLQGAWGGQKLYQIVIGLVLSVKPPWEAIGWGCLSVVVITTLASLPAALRLVSRQPRELLGAMKG